MGRAPPILQREKCQKEKNQVIQWKWSEQKPGCLSPHHPQTLWWNNPVNLKDRPRQRWVILTLCTDFMTWPLSKGQLQYSTLEVKQKNAAPGFVQVPLRAGGPGWKDHWTQSDVSAEALRLHTQCLRWVGRRGSPHNPARRRRGRQRRRWGPETCWGLSSSPAYQPGPPGRRPPPSFPGRRSYLWGVRWERERRQDIRDQVMFQKIRRPFLCIHRNSMSLTKGGMQQKFVSN